ncbi:MAG: hypothetical protein PUB18_04025 [bacterium]|nr:hypothetical protein [bacterium]
MLERFLMKAQPHIQYHIIAVRVDVFLKLNRGKNKRKIKSLDYIDSIFIEYKTLIGDMNMISYVPEVHTILQQNVNYITLSRNKKDNYK